MPRYKPWTYANRDDVREMRRKEFRNNAEYHDEQVRTSAREPSYYGETAAKRVDERLPFAQPAKPEKKGGGGLFGKLKDVAGDALDVGKDVGKGALTALDAPRKYAGAPAFAIASGQLKAERKFDPKTGSYYRDAPDFGDMFASIREAATSDPRDTYREAREAGEERLRDPDLTGGGRFILEAGADPTSYIGPGALKRVGIQAGGRAGRIATNLIESPRKATGGALIGGTAASEAADRAGFGRTGQMVAGFGGAIAGGGIGGSAGGRQAAGRVAQEAGRQMTPAAMIHIDNPDFENFGRALDRRGIDWSVDEEGNLRVDNPADADEAVYALDSTMGKMLPSTERRGGSRGESATVQDRWGKRVKGRSGPRGSRVFEEGELERAEHEAMDDADRLREVMNDDPEAPTREAHREKWQLGTRLPRETDPALREKLEARARANNEDGYAARRELGHMDAEDIAQEMVRPDWSPEWTIREMAMVDMNTNYGKATVPIRQAAMLERLKEISDDIDANAREVAHTIDDDLAREHERFLDDAGDGAEAPAGERDATADRAGGGVRGAEGEAGGRAPTVKRVDLEGNVTDTFQTEGELAGIREQQGDLLGRGEAEAKLPPKPMLSSEMVTEPITSSVKNQFETFEEWEAARAPGEPPNIRDFRHEGDYHAAVRVMRDQRFQEQEAQRLASQAEDPLAQRRAGQDVGMETAFRPKGRKTQRREPLTPEERAQRRREKLQAAPTEPVQGAEMGAARGADLVPGQPQTATLEGAPAGAQPGAGIADTTLARDPGALKPGMKVRAADRDNIGTILRMQGQTARVHFRSPDGTEATVSLPVSALSPLNKPPGARVPGDGGIAPPGGRTGPGGQEGFGEEPVDLLGTKSRQATIEEGVKRDTSVTGRLSNAVKSALGRLEPEDVRTKVNPVLRAKNEVDQRIEHLTGWFVTREKAYLHRAGMEMKLGEDGYYHLFAGDRDVGYFDDVIEQTSDAGRAGYTSLTPEQQAALGKVGETNRLFNGTVKFHGGKVRIDDTIEGDYFGRRATGREYKSELTGETVRIEKLAGGQPSRKVGAQRTKSRTHEAIEKGREAGITYENPWDARTAILRGKLLDAEDAWTKKSLAPLRVKKPGSTLGLEQVGDHPGFNNMWFDPKVARRIRSGLDGPKHGIAEGVAKSINSVLTPLRASYDMSASLQQGLRMWLSDPKHAGEYWWGVTRSLKDETVYERMILKFDERAQAMGFTLEDLMRTNLRFTGEGAVDDFFLPVGATEKLKAIPGVGKAVAGGFTASQRHFGRTLNAYRLEFALNQAERLQAGGIAPRSDEWLEAMGKTNAGINRAFGYTASQPSRVEQIAFFAPKYTRASVETLLYAVSKGGIEGSMARRHMGLMLAEGAALTWALNEARGYETDFDPTSSNFLRIRNVGGLDVSPFGTYNTLFRAVAGTIAGDPVAAPWKFAEGKMSPALKLAYEPFIKRETYTGEPLDPLGSPQGLFEAVKQQAESSLPFPAQNLVEEGPLAAAVGALGVSSTPMTPAERRDEARAGDPGGINLPRVGNVQTTGRDRPGLAQEMFGEEYDELAARDKSIVNEDPRVAGHQEEVDRRNAKGDRFSKEQLRVATQVDALAAELETGEISGNQFREQYQSLLDQLDGARSALGEKGGRDKEIDGYFALKEKATLASGRVDYAQLETLQEAYAQTHPGIEEKLLKWVGTRDSATLREYREARRQANTYYDLAAYRGMEVDESREASAIIAAANDMVSNGEARNRNHALAKLFRAEPEGVKLARRALRVGSNPARKKFRRAPENAAFRRFYSDTTALAA